MTIKEKPVRQDNSDKSSDVSDWQLQMRSLPGLIAIPVCCRLITCWTLQVLTRSLSARPQEGPAEVVGV